MKADSIQTLLASPKMMGALLDLVLDSDKNLTPDGLTALRLFVAIGQNNTISDRLAERLSSSRVEDRRRAAWALKESLQFSLVPDLIGRFKTDSDVMVRVYSLQALAAMREPSKQFLKKLHDMSLQAVGDDQALIRFAGYETLSVIGDSSSLPILRLAATDSDSAIRATTPFWIETLEQFIARRRKLNSIKRRNEN